MKKILSGAMAAVLAAGLLGGCAATKSADTLTIWVYPVGDFAEPEADETTGEPGIGAAEALAAAFEKAQPGTSVEIVYKSFGTDDELATAQQGTDAPDLILDSAERLLRAAQAGGTLADVGGLGWDESMTADVDAVSTAILPACRDAEGSTLVWPASVSVSCMAINREMFETAGIGELIGEDLCWTPDEFDTALQALQDSGCYMPAMLYGGVVGDQASRMLLQNRTGEAFTDAAHTSYTFGGSAAVAALQNLVQRKNENQLRYISDASAVDELSNFADGSSGMSLCWSPETQAAYAAQTGFTPVAVAFPAEDTPQLYGTVYGFGLPRNGENRDAVSAAAIRFVQFALTDAAQAAETVRATGALPAYASLADAYADTEDAERMAQFTALLPYLGDLYGVTPNWREQRVAWHDMLETTFTGKGNEVTEPEPTPTPDPDADPDAPAEETPAAEQPQQLDDAAAAVQSYEAAVAALK